MVSRNIKLFIGIFILLAYISIGVLGLFNFNHAFEKQMTDCPYSQGGYSVCDNNIDHINDWRQFSNITVSSLFVLAFLIIGIILYFFDRQSFLNQQQHFYKWEYYLDNKKLYSSRNRITIK